MISKASNERVIKRLQQENARSPYLNSLPGKIKSYSKLDFDYLQAFNSTLKSKLTEAISSGKSFTYYHNPEKTTTSIVDDSPIQRCIKTILEQRLLKQKSMKQRRRNHLRSKSAIFL